MRIYLILITLFFYSGVEAQIVEPYKTLNGGSFSGDPVQASPDPLVNYRWLKPLAADSLQIYTLVPSRVIATPSKYFFISKQSNPSGQIKAGSFLKHPVVANADVSNTIMVKGVGDLMFDFGTESAGWLEFDSDDLADTVSVEASISEYNEPAILNAGAQFPVKTRRLNKYGNTYRLELNNQLYEGVRFAWIHIRKFSKTFTIKNVRLVCQVKPANYKGSFYSNDTMLNRIWYLGAYVVKLNALQDFFGAILMERSDRHSWTGDAYPAQAAALAAFGNYNEIGKNIAFTSGQDNGIPAYSIYWVLSLIEYYQYSGDSVLFARFISNADKRLKLAMKQYDSVPSLSFMGWDERLGAGFEHADIKESQNAFRMLCINACSKFSEALAHVKQTSLSEAYADYVRLKTDELKDDPTLLTSFGVHALSEAINAGLDTMRLINDRSKALYADRVNRLSYSPFNQYFILQAMGQAGDYQAALQTVHDAWGGQVQYGGTCFFEVFRPSWNKSLSKLDAPPNNQCGYTSLAHPWGAGVTKWLSENVLGVIPVKPGFTEFDIVPNLFGSLTSVKGAMPTPSGNIVADFNIETGRFVFTVPEGTLAREIHIPTAGRGIASMTINGKLVKINANETSVRYPMPDSSFIRLNNFGPGKYIILLKYKAKYKKQVVPVADYIYPISKFKQDSITLGNWVKLYGRDGYMLFGGAKKMPRYVDSVHLRLNKMITWSRSSLESSVKKSILVAPLTSAVADPKDAGVAMSESSDDDSTGMPSAIITQDPLATLQTMTIDVRVNKDQPYYVSLYLLDADKKDRRTAVEIFDLETLNIISPVAIIDHYEKGKYLSFRSDRSIRIRVNHVRGSNAAVSGIFFDPVK